MSSSFHPERIVLTGFMGSGKSTVGRLLARRLGWAFVDLDAAVEARAGKTVPAIFAEDGEAAFREMESSTLVELLSERNLVLALGGGVPEIAANRDLLRKTAGTFVVLLEAPFAILMERCARQAEELTATVRPNLASHAAAQERFTRRAPLYLDVATEVIASAALTSDETVNAILELLRH